MVTCTSTTTFLSRGGERHQRPPNTSIERTVFGCRSCRTWASQKAALEPFRAVRKPKYTNGVPTLFVFTKDRVNKSLIQARYLHQPKT